MNDPGRERRVHRRIAAPARAHIVRADGSRLELPVRDVSLGGIFLFTKELPAPVGDTVTLEIHLPASTYVARVDAEIVRSVEEPAGQLLGIGCRFMEPSPDQRLALQLLLTHLLEGAGGERRAYPRVSHRVALKCSSRPPFSVFLRDLSHGGAGLWVDEPLDVGSALTIEIDRSPKDPLSLAGTVTSCAPREKGEPYVGLGLRFENVSPQRQAELDAYLEALVRGS